MSEPASDGSAKVSLELDSRPESVSLVRSALSGLGERLEIDAELLDDIKTAVSEACNNVVMHAYATEPGPLIVSLLITAGRADVLVRDRGSGIQRVSAAEDRMGVGLAVISALADRAEFLTGPDGGTDVRMSFGHDRGAHEPGEVPVPATPYAAMSLPADVVVSLAPVTILAPVFGRLARAVAASSHFSVDRFRDLYPITDAIAAFAETSSTSETLSCSITSTTRRIELTLAPFAAGSRTRLDQSDGLDPRQARLAGLADELSSEAIDGFEALRVVVVDNRSSPRLSG